MYPKTDDNNIDIVVFYRPPPSQTNGFSFRKFMNQWTDFSPSHIVKKSDLIILGTVIIHLNDATSCKDKIFIDSLSDCGLQQHVMQPTHYKGHTLDVVITIDTSELVDGVQVRDIGLTYDNGLSIHDHYAIL